MSKVVDYFLKYVAFDTQSAEDAGTVPSTEKTVRAGEASVRTVKEYRGEGRLHE